MPQLDFFIFFDEGLTVFVAFFFFYYIFLIFFIPIFLKKKILSFFFNNYFLSCLFFYAYCISSEFSFIFSDRGRKGPDKVVI